MFMGEINFARTDPYGGGATVVAQPAPQDHAWQRLSLPERRELQASLKRCNKPGSSDVELLISCINNQEVRMAALSLLCRKDYLIRNPQARGKLLETLLPYSHEGRVRAYAMLSLRDEFNSRSYAVCAPAARIIDVTKRDRDPALTYELIDLAARLTPQGRDAAARIAFILLKDSPLTSGQFQLAQFHARVWYIEHKGDSNPWLDVIARLRTPAAVRFLRSIIEGNVSDPRDYVILKNVISLPLLPHEVAVTASVLTITAQKLANFFGVQNNLAATSSALAATALIVGGRYMLRARRLDQINCKRTAERLEALKHLCAILDSTHETKTATHAKLQRCIMSVLRDQTVNLLQDPQVQQAAAQALTRL